MHITADRLLPLGSFCFALVRSFANGFHLRLPPSITAGSSAAAAEAHSSIKAQSKTPQPTPAVNRPWNRIATPLCGRHLPFGTSETPTKTPPAYEFGTGTQLVSATSLPSLAASRFGSPSWFSKHTKM